MAADLPDGVDDVLPHLLCQLRELLLGERLQILGPVDVREQAHELLVYMKSVIRSSSAVVGGPAARLASPAAPACERRATSARASRAVRWDSAASSLAPASPCSL